MAQTARAPIFELTQQEYGARVCGVIKRCAANENKPAAWLAVVAGCTVGTAQNWLDGTSTPNGLYLTRLRSQLPELAAELRRLETMEAELHPDAQRLASEIAQIIIARSGR